MRAKLAYVQNKINTGKGANKLELSLKYRNMVKESYCITKYEDLDQFEIRVKSIFWDIIVHAGIQQQQQIRGVGLNRPTQQEFEKRLTRLGLKIIDFIKRMNTFEWMIKTDF